VSKAERLLSTTSLGVVGALGDGATGPSDAAGTVLAATGALDAVTGGSGAGAHATRKSAITAETFHGSIAGLIARAVTRKSGADADS
jgi:hypothetical protein